MRRRRVVQIVIGLGLLGVLAFGIARGLERLFSRVPAASDTSATAPASSASVAHITATIFYAAPDGQSIIGVRRDVPLADGIVAQGREILLAQLEPAPAPYTTVIPAGTKVRGFYVTPGGDAFVDLSPDVTTAHGGGSLGELLTVSAIVNAVTVNLPSVQRVQILIDGKEADTLAGHIDLRRSLQSDGWPVTRP